MSVNDSRFQTIAIGKSKNMGHNEIHERLKIKFETNVFLLGAEVDDNLKFDALVDNFQQMQQKNLILNSLEHLAMFMGNKEGKPIKNSLILCHFNYCPLIWMLCSKGSQEKLEKIN